MVDVFSESGVRLSNDPEMSSFVSFVVGDHELVATEEYNAKHPNIWLSGYWL